MKDQDQNPFGDDDVTFTDEISVDENGNPVEEPQGDQGQEGQDQGNPNNPNLETEEQGDPNAFNIDENGEPVSPETGQGEGQGDQEGVPNNEIEDFRKGPEGGENEEEEDEEEEVEHNENAEATGSGEGDQGSEDKGTSSSEESSSSAAGAEMISPFVSALREQGVLSNDKITDEDGNEKEPENVQDLLELQKQELNSKYEEYKNSLDEADDVRTMFNDSDCGQIGVAWVHGKARTGGPALDPVEFWGAESPHFTAERAGSTEESDAYKLYHE